MTDHILTRAENLGVGGFFSRVRRIAAHWIKRRRLYWLQQLDDNTLYDIGLLREEVNAALLQPLSVDLVRDLHRRAWARRVCGPKFRFR